MDSPSIVLDPDKEKTANPNHTQNISTSSTNLSSQATITGGISTSTSSIQQSIEKLSRPIVFDKMESLVREMQDSETGVPVRSQKLFLTSIPSAFMGYDLIEWLMERLNIEESEALNIANQLCQYGYFFPVNDSKILVVKDDSSLYRFQIPYYFGQHKPPDNIDYAIYLTKRSLRNKQRHGLDDYELEALSSLHKNLKGKWDFITMQAEEQARLAKERKKGDKIVSDSQERAYWRVNRPPPGLFTPLEPCPIPSRDRQGKPRKRTSNDWQREVDILKVSLGRNRVKMSQACESLVQYFEIFSDYDPFINSPLPSNPWVTEDLTYWQINSQLVEIPTEKRVKRWAISIEELVSDPTGLQEFTLYLKKEYSHENIRFWMAVNDLRRSAYSQINVKVKAIYDEFLAPGAPCEINIDGKTMEMVHQGLKNPSRFAFDSAADHIYTLLLKKDCYPRFIRSEQYKNLLATGLQPSHKKRFFGFGGANKKKPSTAAQPSTGLLSQISGQNTMGSLSRRRGSDRSLSGSAHELAVCGVKDITKVPHSHSQSNLSDIPYRDGQKSYTGNLEASLETTGGASAVCPWDTVDTDTEVVVSVCPWETEETSTFKNNTTTESGSSSSDVSEMSDKMRRFCGLRQNTLDSDFHSTKRLAPTIAEQRRSSMTVTPRLSEKQLYNLRPTSLSASSSTNMTAATPSPNQVCDQSFSQLPLNMKKTVSFEETEELKLLIANPSASKENLSINQDSTSTSIDKIDTATTKDSTDPKYEIVTESEVSATTAPMKIKLQNQNTTPSISVMFASAEDDIEEEEESVNVAQSSDSSEIVANVDILGASKDPMPQSGSQIFETESNTDLESTKTLFKTLSQEHEQELELSMNDGSVLSGYVAPAPTPAPSIAPLAEIENVGLDDFDEDEFDLEVSNLESPKALISDVNENNKKRRKKNKKDKEKKLDTPKAEVSGCEQSTSNTVCPWDDDTVSTSVDSKFVKTYSTLGYL